MEKKLHIYQPLMQPLNTSLIKIIPHTDIFIKCKTKKSVITNQIQEKKYCQSKYAVTYLFSFYTTYFIPLQPDTRTAKKETSVLTVFLFVSYYFCTIRQQMPNICEDILIKWAVSYFCFSTSCTTVFPFLSCGIFFQFPLTVQRIQDF